VLAAIVVAAFGLAPRYVAIGWAALAGFVVLGELGPLMKLSHWIMDLSPFVHVPRLPGGPLSATPLVALTAVAALLAAAGLAGLRRRDIGSSWRTAAAPHRAGSKAVHSGPPPWVRIRLLPQSRVSVEAPFPGQLDGGLDTGLPFGPERVCRRRHCLEPQRPVCREHKGTAMNPSEEIDNLIAQHQDWRGATLAELRKTILEVDPEIVEEWKWMGSPVWELNGIICVGNIFKTQVQLVFMDGAALDDPENLFNAGLEGNRRRTIAVYEGAHVEEAALKTLVRAAISYNQAKKKK
jgi:hypothetical protein